MLLNSGMFADTLLISTIKHIITSVLKNVLIHHAGENSVCLSIKISPPSYAPALITSLSPSTWYLVKITFATSEKRTQHNQIIKILVSPTPANLFMTYSPFL